MLSAALGYVSAVYTMETTLRLKRLKIEGEELRNLTEKLDSIRSQKHNILIDSVRVANRYLFKRYPDEIPTGGVYSGEPLHLSESTLNRRAIGEWAGKIVVKCFSDRR